MNAEDTVEVIDAIANVIGADASIAYEAGGEGIFGMSAQGEVVTSIDYASATLIFYGTDGNPYEVRVRRVTEADCQSDPAGIVPPAMRAGDDDE